MLLRSILMSEYIYKTNEGVMNGVFPAIAHSENSVGLMVLEGLFWWAHLKALQYY